MKNVAVIGGGPAGIMAAISAARNGNKVTVFEKQKKLLRKLYVTGNGTCNITNVNASSDQYNLKNNKFINEILDSFSVADSLKFFNSLGLHLFQKKDGRMYPFSLQASSVADAMECELSRLNVDLKLHRRIDSIFKNKKDFKIVTAGREEHTFDTVIIACGGPAAPDLGGSKKGAVLAERTGHKVIQFIPVITPLNIVEKQLHRLEGIRWDCRLSVVQNDKNIVETIDELLFTKYGISGPATLDISSATNRFIAESKKCEIHIDFFPQFDKESLADKVKETLVGGKTLIQCLNGLTKKRIGAFILSSCGLDINKNSNELSHGDVKKISDMFKCVVIHPGEMRDFRDAVTAAGGVDINDINEMTMESKKVKGLYFTGEIIDVDGNCGGYNLQFAWSTGAIAGSSLN